MFKVFLRLWQVNWAEQWQYRANMMMYVVYSLVSPVVYLSVWRSVAAGQAAVSGYTANDFTVYYLMLLIVSNLTGEITIHILAYKIQDGTLSGELLRPAHPILTQALVYNIAFKALTFIVLTPIWLLLFLLFRPDFSGVTAGTLLVGVPALLLGFAINFLFGAAVTCVAFWTTRVYALSEFLYALVMMLGGSFVPLGLLPGAVQQVAQFAPFQLYLYFPVELILGRLSPDQIALNFTLQAAWLAVMAAVFGFAWREGIKRFSAVGA